MKKESLNQKVNLKRLDDRIKKIKLKGEVIIVFDFDELVVPIHLTREVTRIVSKPISKEELEVKGSCSFEGIRYLNSLIIGYNFEDYKKIRDNIAKGTEWREGFKELLKNLCKKYTVIFISSGMKDICYSKLKEIKFEPKNIIGDEFEIKKNKIKGSNLIISDELKGYVIDNLKKKSEVVAIGHSLGDKMMLERADVSISFRSDIPHLAKFNVTSPNEIIQIIKNKRRSFKK